MKQFLVTLAFIILAVFLVNTFIFGEDSMKTQANRIGGKMIADMKVITGN